MNVLSFKNGVLIFTILLVCFGCSGIGSLSNEKGKPYPQSVKDEFMKGCQKGSDETFCSCVFEKVQQEYSLAEFAEIEKKLKAGAPPKEFTEFTGKAASECRK
jgi:hypothetical protein